MNDPMLTQAIEAKLAHRDIRATSSRILVLRALMTRESALSLSDLEAILPTLDKSTLFRTLTTFAAHHLVHIVEDGSGLAKYALCADDCHCGEEMMNWQTSTPTFTASVASAPSVFVAFLCPYPNCPRDF